MNEPTTRELLVKIEGLQAEIATLRRGRRRRARLLPVVLAAILAALLPLAVLADFAFLDLDPNSPHNDNITAIRDAGLTKGCDPPAFVSYCPKDGVTREEMASFLARLGGLGANPPVANAARLGGQPAGAYLQNGSSPTFANLTVTGAVTRAYTPGTTNAAAPLAYGFVKNDGTLLSGTPNVSTSFDSTLNRYVITIAGENYSFGSYATVVTINSSKAFASTGSLDGKLLVFTRDASDNHRPGDGFSFITYKP